MARRKLGFRLSCVRLWFYVTQNMWLDSVLVSIAQTLSVIRVSISVYSTLT